MRASLRSDTSQKVPFVFVPAMFLPESWRRLFAPVRLSESNFYPTWRSHAGLEYAFWSGVGTFKRYLYSTGLQNREGLVVLFSQLTYMKQASQSVYHRFV